MIKEIHIVTEIYRAIRHLVYPGKEITMNAGVHAVTFKGNQIEIIVERTPVFERNYLQVDGEIIEAYTEFSRDTAQDITSDRYIDSSVSVYYKGYVLKQVSEFPAIARAIRVLIKEMTNENIGI